MDLANIQAFASRVNDVHLSLSIFVVELLVSFHRNNRVRKRLNDGNVIQNPLIVRRMGFDSLDQQPLPGKALADLVPLHWITSRVSKKIELLLDKGPHLLIFLVSLRLPLAKQSQCSAFAILDLSLGLFGKLLLTGGSRLVRMWLAHDLLLPRPLWRAGTVQAS
jgi:hypothetical protein